MVNNVRKVFKVHKVIFRLYGLSDFRLFIDNSPNTIYSSIKKDIILHIVLNDQTRYVLNKKIQGIVHWNFHKEKTMQKRTFKEIL